MVAEDQQILFAKIIDQPFTLIEIKRDTFIGMISDVIMHLHRELRVAPEPGLLN